jgi:hypothetical protein
MEINPSDEKFSSNDIPTVAFLAACGHKIIEQKQNDELVTFIFAKNEKLLEDLFKYSSNAAFPIQSFYKSLSYIWTLIKQGRKPDA